MNKYWYLGFLFLPLLLTGCVSQSQTAKTETNPLLGKNILFYGDTCPHCKIVEQYISDNQILNKMPLAQKEVYKNQTNAAEMVVAARACGLSQNDLGVPFLWVDNKCLSGDTDIVNFFKTKFKL